MSCVLDASMTLSFILADAFTAASQRTLDSIAEHGAVAPALWEFEVLNGLRSAEQRGRISEAGITNALRGLAKLPIEQDRRSPDGVRVIGLSREFDVSAYDATYLWLAMEANLPLASLDAGLIRAAHLAGIKIA